MYHCGDAAGVVVVAGDIASWVTLNLLQFIDVSASVRIPHGKSILNHRSNVRLVGWVSDAEAAGSEITVQESSSAIRFLSNRIDVVVEIQFAPRSPSIGRHQIILLGNRGTYV